MTPYHLKVNEAAQKLCLQNPELLSDRAKLLEVSRKKVHEEGYQYRKGTSRSKRLRCGSEQHSTPKRSKVSEDVRLRRISELQEDIKDASDQIKIKEKTRSLASNAHQYKDCDRFTSQISVLRQKLREHRSELSEMQKKQRKSKWYKTRRSGSDRSKSPPPASHSACLAKCSPSISPISSSCSSSFLHSPIPVEVPSDSSRRFRSPSPLMSPKVRSGRLSFSSPSPVPSLSPFASSVIGSTDSECELSSDCSHDYSGDTVILTSEDESDDDHQFQLRNPLVNNSRGGHFPDGEVQTDSSPHFR